MATLRKIRGLEESQPISSILSRAPSGVAMRSPQSCGLCLSLFPGAGLLDEGFTQAGFAVVRGPDLLLGQDIRRLTLAGLLGRSHFDGIIAGLLASVSLTGS